MTELASAVHTTGVNWESVGAIAACVTVIMTFVLWIWSRGDRRLERIVAREDQTHKEIVEQMREDRRATNERLTWLERNLWSRLPVDPEHR
jgi:K+ transporter